MTISIFSVITFSFAGYPSVCRCTKFSDISFHRFSGIKNKYPRTSCDFNAESATANADAACTYMHLRLSTDACDDFCSTRFKIKRSTSYGNIFMRFQRGIDYRDTVKIECTPDYGSFPAVYFFLFVCHFRVTPALLSFLRTFLKRCVDVRKKKITLPQYTM